MAPTNRGVAKQVQPQRTTAATPVYNHDGNNIVVANENRQQQFRSLNIPFNVPPGVQPRDETPFTQFAQQQQSSNGMGNNMNMGSMSPFGQQQFGNNNSFNNFQNGYYNQNNGMRQMTPQNSNFYPNGAGAQSGSLGPMFNNGMQSPEPFGSQSMQQQQGQYGMPMNYNMNFGFPGQQQQNGQQFGMQGNMYNNNMMPFSPTSNSDFNSNYEPPSTSSSEISPDHEYNVEGGMDMDDLEGVDMINGGYGGLLSPTAELLTSPSSDRMSAGGLNGSGGLSGGNTENGSDTVVKGEDFGTNSTTLSPPPMLGEAKCTTPTLLSKSSSMSSTTANGTIGKPSLPSSKEKEQNKQKLYRNRKSEFTNKMRDELLGMGMLPSTRVTHAPEIMSKTADTLRDYRELLELIQNKIEGMPSNIAAVPGAVKKLLNENGNVFNNLRQAPPVSLAQTPQPQQQATHSFKPDIKHPLGANISTTPNNTNQTMSGRVTRSGAHVY